MSIRRGATLSRSSAMVLQSLELGNRGALASKPVMEGKAVLFKRFADVDVFDIEVDTEDAAEMVRFCELIAPTFRRHQPGRHKGARVFPESSRRYKRGLTYRSFTTTSTERLSFQAQDC